MSNKSILICALAILTMSSLIIAAQQTPSIQGRVVDLSGRPIAKLNIVARNSRSGEEHAAVTNDAGEFRFAGLAPGIYLLQNPASPNTTGNAPSVGVNPSQNNNNNGGLALQANNSGVIQFEAETVSSSKEVTTVKNEFTEEPIQALPQSNQISKDGEEHGAKNLSLLTEAVTPGSYVQTGVGPSVAGRPNTTNNFEINGIDNNNQAAPGPLVAVSNEAIHSFSLVQGDAVSQLAHSTGGQLNEIVSQGTNLWHGGIYDYLNTRKLNAVEPSLPGNLPTQRYDQNRMGFTVDGPLKTNTLFAFVNFEYVPLRASRIQLSPVFAPIAAGYATVATIPGISATNLEALRNSLGVATDATSSTTIDGVLVPLGSANTEERLSSDFFNILGNIDWRMGSTSKITLRYGHNDYGTNSFGLTLPAFQVPGHSRALFGALNYTGVMGSGMTFSANAGYNRSDVKVGGGDFAFPLLPAFPNIEIQDIGASLGSNVAAGRIRTNMYEGGVWGDQAFGGHHIRAGVDVRVMQSVFGNLTGDNGIFGYSTLGRFLLDQSPDAGAQQSFGGSTFNGGRTLLNAFVQDKLRYRGVDVDAGLSWQYSQLPESVRLQRSLGSLSVPGLIDFDRPRTDRLNIAPHVGIALSPGSEKTTVRAGFGMLFDALEGPAWFIGPDTRVTTLSNTALVSPLPGFLGTGGLTSSFTSANGINTFAFDQKLPYIEHWNAGFSRAIFGRMTAEVKYIGNHGIHQPLQTILNDPTNLSALNSLPVFLTDPGIGTLNSLTVTQQSLFAQTNPFTVAGFRNPILAVRNDGTSWYNAGVVKLNERFSGGTQISAEYTYADTRSDSTGSFLDLAYGRRMEQSIWGRKHRATITPVLDISYLTRNWSGKARNAVSNLTVTTTLSYERGARVPLFNGAETGFIGIPAGTGVFVNPAGVPGTSTSVAPLTNGAGQVVAFLARNPNAQFIAGAPGTFSADRPTFRMGDTRNIDLSIVKKFAIRHTVKLEARGDAFNLLNHPQFTGLPISTIGNASSNIPGFLLVSNPQFNNMRGWVSANPRTIQLALHVTF